MLATFHTFPGLSLSYIDFLDSALSGRPFPTCPQLRIQVEEWLLPGVCTVRKAARPAAVSLLAWASDCLGPCFCFTTAHRSQGFLVQDQFQGQGQAEGRVSQDCVLGAQAGWAPRLLVGTRTLGDVAELQVQEAGVAMDPGLACDWRGGSLCP